MKIVKYIVLVVGAALLLLNSYALFFTKDAVYVDIGKLVSSFKLKQELEKESTGKLLIIKNVIDSLRLANGLKPGGPAKDSQSLNIKRLEMEFERLYTNSNDELTHKVWERLNPILDGYGKKHNYKIILGATGTGTILFGDKKYDITDDVVRYANETYAKGS